MNAQLWSRIRGSARRDLADPFGSAGHEALHHRLRRPSLATEGMICTVQPLHLCIGEGGDMPVEELHTAQGITGALEEQKRDFHVGEVGYTQLLRFPGRVQWVCVKDNACSFIAFGHPSSGRPETGVRRWGEGSLPHHDDTQPAARRDRDFSILARCRDS